MLELPPEAFLALCREFATHCLAGAFHEREWWQWKCEGDSIWVEVIPEAIALGKNRRRTLAELFKGAE